MEKAPVDTSDVEEKAEEVLAAADPPPDVYLYWAPGFAFPVAARFTPLRPS